MTRPGDAQRIEAEIEALFNNATHSEEGLEEVQASLARYACVLTSSYIEAALRELILLYTSQRANASVLRYVESTLTFLRAPNMEKILQVVGRLDPEYRKALETQTEGKIKDSVDSIHANRNNIAHGRRSGISLGQVRAYYSDVKEVISKTRVVVGV